MNKNKIVMSLAVASMLVFSGCADKAMKQEAQKSNFLGNYSDLKEDKKYEGAASWISPTADFKKYDSIVINPIQVNHGLTKEELTPERVALFEEISVYLTKGYRAEMERATDLKVVSSAGANTMVFNGSISAVKVHNDDLKFYQFIPIALAITAISRAVSDNATVRILGEGKLLDGQTNDVLLRSMSLQKGKEVKSTGKTLTLDDVKPALDQWIRFAGQRINDLKNQTKK